MVVAVLIYGLLMNTLMLLCDQIFSIEYYCDGLSGSGKAFTDDSRLSVLMKRVLRPDDDRDRRLQFVKQLHEYFVVPENFGVCSVYDVFIMVFYRAVIFYD